MLSTDNGIEVFSIWEDLFGLVHFIMSLKIFTTPFFSWMLQIYRKLWLCFVCEYVFLCVCCLYLCAWMYICLFLTFFSFLFYRDLNMIYLVNAVFQQYIPTRIGLVFLPQDPASFVLVCLLFFFCYVFIFVSFCFRTEKFWKTTLHWK